MVDRFLSRQGVGIALVFMIAELSYINSKSLQFMFEGSNSLDIWFGVIGAVAFSIVTVLIMRLSNQEWLKICFPLFDIALVFCGLNLSHSHDILANPVRFAMSIFLSVFSGLITFSLGQINAVQHEGGSEATRLKLLESELSITKSNLAETSEEKHLLERDLSRLNSILNNRQANETILQGKVSEYEHLFETNSNEIMTLESILSDKSSEINELQSKLKVAQQKANTYEVAALSAEAANIRKKKEHNRTTEDLQLLAKVEKMLKAA